MLARMLGMAATAAGAEVVDERWERGLCPYANCCIVFTILSVFSYVSHTRIPCHHMLAIEQ